MSSSEGSPIHTPRPPRTFQHRRMTTIGPSSSARGAFLLSPPAVGCRPALVESARHTLTSRPIQCIRGELQVPEGLRTRGGVCFSAKGPAPGSAVASSLIFNDA